MMARRVRDREAERTSIRSAADRMLTGTPLRSTSGKLTVTELIAECGLRRDIVYDHSDIVEGFQARVKAQHSTPDAYRELAEQNAVLIATLADTKRRLDDARANSALLRQAIAELSLELQQAKEELAGIGGVAMLRTGRSSAVDSPWRSETSGSPE